MDASDKELSILELCLQVTPFGKLTTHRLEYLPCSIGNTSSNGPCSIAMWVYRSVPPPPENSWLEHPKTGGFVDVDVFSGNPLGSAFAGGERDVSFQVRFQCWRRNRPWKKRTAGPGKAVHPNDDFQPAYVNLPPLENYRISHAKWCLQYDVFLLKWSLFRHHVNLQGTKLATRVQTPPISPPTACVCVCGCEFFTQQNPQEKRKTPLQGGHPCFATPKLWQNSVDFQKSQRQKNPSKPMEVFRWHIYDSW